MEILSNKKCARFIVKKLGYKMIQLDNYEKEESEVNLDFFQKSPECIDETKAGAKFYWSNK